MRRGIVILLVALLLLSGCTVHRKLPPVAPPFSTNQNGEQDGELTVHTDWSKLDDGDKLLPSVGSRWYDEYTGQLIVRDDYGPLIPYAGLRLMDDWPAITGCLYGLMTTDGLVVTDAVYSSVTRPEYYIGAKRASHPLLVLTMGVQSDDVDGYVRGYRAVAAGDGSWCTDFCYRGMRAIESGLLLFEDDRISYMSPAGVILRSWTMASLRLTQEEMNSINMGLEWGDGWFGMWYGDYFCLGFTDEANNDVSVIRLSTGRKVIMDRNDFWDALIQASDDDQSDMEDFAANLPPGDYSEINYLWDNISDDSMPALIAASQYDAGGMLDLFFLIDGTPLPELTRRTGSWYYSVRPVGGFIEVLDLKTASYYDIVTMDCAFRIYLGYDAD